MVHLQGLGKEEMLQVNHVIVDIVWKFGVQAVAGFGRVTVAHVVGKDDEVAADVQKLLRPEEQGGKMLGRKLLSAPGGAVENQDSVGYTTAGVGGGFAIGGVVQVQFGKDLTRLESVIVEREVGFHRFGQLLRGKNRGQPEGEDRQA